MPRSSAAARPLELLEAATPQLVEMRLVPARPRVVRESTIVARIRKRLGREPDLWLRRNSVGVAREIGTGGRVRFAAHGLGKGSPDLVGVLAVEVQFGGRALVIGRFFALEVKVPGWVPRRTEEREHFARQLAFLGKVRRRGGFGAVVHSEDEAVAALERARRGERE